MSVDHLAGGFAGTPIKNFRGLPLGVGRSLGRRIRRRFGENEARRLLLVSVDHLAGGFAGQQHDSGQSALDASVGVGRSLGRRIRRQAMKKKLKPLPEVSVDHLAGGFAGVTTVRQLSQCSRCRSITWPADSPASGRRAVLHETNDVSVDHLAGGFAGRDARNRGGSPECVSVDHLAGGFAGRHDEQDRHSAYGVGRSLGRRIRRPAIVELATAWNMVCRSITWPADSPAGSKAKRIFLSVGVGRSLGRRIRRRARPNH